MAKPDVAALNANPEIRRLAMAVNAAPIRGFKSPEKKAAIEALYAAGVPRPTGNDTWSINPDGTLEYHTNRGQSIAQGIGTGVAIGAGGLVGAGALGLLGGAPAFAGGAGGGGTAGGSVGTLGTIGNYLKKGYDAYNQYSGIIGDVGDLAGSMAQGRAAGRAAEANYNLDRDALALRQAQLAKEFEGTDIRRMLATAMLGNGQDLRINVPGLAHADVTGGPSFSALTPELRQALLRASSAYGQAIPGAANPVARVPGLTPTPEAGLGDKILGAMGTVGQFGGALGGLKKPPTPVPTGAYNFNVPSGRLPLQPLPVMPYRPPAESDRQFQLMGRG